LLSPVFFGAGGVVQHPYLKNTKRIVLVKKNRFNWNGCFFGKEQGVYFSGKCSKFLNFHIFSQKNHIFADNKT